MAFNPNDFTVYEDSSGGKVIDAGFGIGNVRKNLGATPQFYVGGANASDSNDGQSQTLTAVLHGPTSTINAALAKALAIDANQGAITINIAAGTYNENIAVNGFVTGACSNTGFVSAATEPTVNFVGAGSGLTIINGGNTVLGQPYAYAFLANRGAHIVLSGMKVQATHNVSVGSCFYAQFYGSITFLSDVIGDASTGPTCLGEEGGFFEVNPGGSATCLTFQGSTSAAVALSAKSMFQADVPVLFAGNPAYSIAAFNAGQDSHIKLSGTAAISGSFTGPRIALSGNSSIFTTSGASLAATGSIGTATTGGVWEGCPSATVTSQAGTGSTGGTTIDTGGDPYHGTVRLQPSGTGIAASGNLFLSFPYKLLGGGYSVGVSNSGASWTSTPWFTMTDGSGTPQIGWVNGAALTTGQIYVLTYVGRG